MDDNLTFRSVLFWAKEKDEKVYASLNINESAIREQDNELTFL
jgi:protein involved in sex pheromone biosynthesis